MEEAGAAELTGDYGKAAASYRHAAEIAERFEPRDPRRATAWNALGMMYDAGGRFVESEAAYQHALKAAEQSTGKSGLRYADVLQNMGTLYVETGQMARGAKLVREALAIYAAAGPDAELKLAISQNCLAEILSVGSRYQEAEDLLLAALPVLQQHADAGNEPALALNNLGVVRIFQHNDAEARRLLLEALVAMEQRLGPDHPMLIRTLNNLAVVAARSNDREEAGKRLRRAIEISEGRLGQDHPAYGALLANYAAYLRQKGEKSEARTLQARANQILKQSGQRNGIGSLIDINALQRK